MQGPMRQPPGSIQQRLSLMAPHWAACVVTDYRQVKVNVALLLIVLAPLLQGLAIEVRHHWTFLARLAFALI
jgi:hypothetical protein